MPPAAKCQRIRMSTKVFLIPGERFQYIEMVSSVSNQIPTGLHASDMITMLEKKFLPHRLHSIRTGT